VRHHHHCDQPNDPHSVVQQGYLYAFLGWTVHPVTYAERDVNYNNPALFVPELIFLDKYYLFPSAVLFTLLEQQFGVDRTFIGWSLMLPMLLCRIITLLFNVEYHPSPPTDTRRCKSVDNDRFLAILVGEAEHEMHHRCPAKSKRNELDVPCKFHFVLLHWSLENTKFGTLILLLLLLNDTPLITFAFSFYANCILAHADWITLSWMEKCGLVWDLR
jgi:fatty-acid desaturase